MGLLVSSVFRWHHLHFVLLKFLCSVGEPFLRPGLHPPNAPRGAAVNTGQRPPPEAARSGIDGCEHGATLDQLGFAAVMMGLRLVGRRDMRSTTPPFAANERTEGSLPLCAKTRAAPLYSVSPVLGPDHEAIIRFGGKAPRRRAHSNERFDDHVQARVTTTSDRERPVGQDRSPSSVPKLDACASCRRADQAASRSWPVRLSGTENRHKATYGSMTR
jgi:hypothetical protein